MRVTTGSAKGRNLKGPPNDGNPSDVGQDPPGSVLRAGVTGSRAERVLDLYAGHRRNRDRSAFPRSGSRGLRRDDGARRRGDSGKPGAHPACRSWRGASAVGPELSAPEDGAIRSGHGRSAVRRSQPSRIRCDNLPKVRWYNPERSLFLDIGRGSSFRTRSDGWS